MGGLLFNAPKNKDNPDIQLLKRARLRPKSKDYLRIGPNWNAHPKILALLEPISKPNKLMEKKFHYALAIKFKLHQFLKPR